MNFRYKEDNPLLYLYRHHIVVRSLDKKYEKKDINQSTPTYYDIVLHKLFRI